MMSLTQLQRAFTSLDNRVITPLLTGGAGSMTRGQGGQGQFQEGLADTGETSGG